MRARFLQVGLVLCLTTLSVRLDSQDLAAFEKTVTEHTLANGMRFIVVERHEVREVSI